MARHDKAMAKIERDMQIVRMIRDGMRIDDIALATGLSRATISAIHTTWQTEEVTDDDIREIQRAHLEYIMHDVLYPMLRGPGKRIVSPSGKPVYELNDDGSFDFSRPVYDDFAKTDVVNSFLRAQERYAKLVALDRLRGWQADESDDVREAMLYVEQLRKENEALRRRSSSIARAEVVEAQVISGTHES